MHSQRESVFFQFMQKAVNLQGNSRANDFKNPLRAPYMLNLKWSEFDQFPQATAATTWEILYLLKTNAPDPRPHCHHVKPKAVPPSSKKTSFTWADLRSGWGLKQTHTEMLRNKWKDEFREQEGARNAPSSLHVRWRGTLFSLGTHGCPILRRCLNDLGRFSPLGFS